jgi:hypothetical protein
METSPVKPQPSPGAGPEPRGANRWPGADCGNRHSLLSHPFPPSQSLVRSRQSRNEKWGKRALAFARNDNNNNNNNKAEPNSSSKPPKASSTPPTDL